MGEFALGYSGSAFGDCHNPYDPRSPSGSSCGSASASPPISPLSASARIPAARFAGPLACNLVGLRPTLQL